MDAELEEREAETKTIRDKFDAHQEKMEATDLRANPGEMQFEAERREVPKKDDRVKSSGTRKKQYRGRNLAAERRQKPKERRKLVAARTRSTRRANVAWRKRNVVGKTEPGRTWYEEPRKDGPSGGDKGATAM
jgi:hypothetical protein